MTRVVFWIRRIGRSPRDAATKLHKATCCQPARRRSWQPALVPRVFP
jgi:hypothetical protein